MMREAEEGHGTQASGAKQETESVEIHNAFRRT
jgi:hypothetical protein